MPKSLHFFSKFLIGTFFVLIIHHNSNGQEWTDSLHINIGTKITAAGKDFQPFWNKAQQFGVITDDKVDASSYLKINNKTVIVPYDQNRRHSHELSLSYGLSLFNNNHFKDGIVEQAYAQLKFGGFSFTGGRFEENFDDVNNELSSGSFGISHNSLPIPKITFALMDYHNVPFTNGWVQVKGLISHGWMGSDRFFESYLHEKQFYAKFGKGKFKLYGGLQHFVEWGGRRPQDSLYLERSLKGFWDVLIVKEANDGSLDTNIYKGVRPNRPGDQRGLLEYGFYLDNDNWEMHTYFQMPFESGKGIDIRNIDRLAGMCINAKNENAILKSIVVEILYTKQSEGFGSPEMQSYYNNGSYKTGWEYEGKVIGNPFLTNRVDASDYLPVKPFDWKGKNYISGNANILNSRVISLHIGASVKLSEYITSRTLLSPTMNYGARNFAYFYGNGKFQFYGLEEMTYTKKKSRIYYKVGLACDFGKLYDNIGGSVAVNYRIF